MATIIDCWLSVVREEWMEQDGNDGEPTGCDIAKHINARLKGDPDASPPVPPCHLYETMVKHMLAASDTLGMRAAARSRDFLFYQQRQRATRWLMAVGNASTYIDIATFEQLEWARMSELEKLTHAAYQFTMRSKRDSERGIEQDTSVEHSACASLLPFLLVLVLPPPQIYIYMYTCLCTFTHMICPTTEPWLSLPSPSLSILSLHQ